ncbi:hypothetical protein [Chitinibacter sp. S2-10]|uniref:hypothetical protein n=1 Tax=Chitinibacter sp. S2-10 TaxID=3373597 RepID=UPI003977E2B0
MKRFVFPVLLATALVGCGNSQEVEQLKNGLATSQTQNQALQTELNRFKLAKEAQDPKLMETYYNTLRSTTTWGEFPDKPEIAGYEQAKRTLATIVLVNGTMKQASGNPEAMPAFVAALRTMGQVWPDRMSEEGKKIHDILWACQDAVVLSRLTLEAVSDSRAKDMTRLAPVQADAVARCSLGLALISKNGK